MPIWGIPIGMPTLLFPNNSPQCLDGGVSYLRIVLHAEVAKLADALASGASGRQALGVQVPSSALFYNKKVPHRQKPEKFLYGDEGT